MTATKGKGKVKPHHQPAGMPIPLQKVRVRRRQAGVGMRTKRTGGCMCMAAMWMQSLFPARATWREEYAAVTVLSLLLPVLLPALQLKLRWKQPPPPPPPLQSSDRSKHS